MLNVHCGQSSIIIGCDQQKSRYWDLNRKKTDLQLCALVKNFHNLSLGTYMESLLLFLKYSVSG
jgi:hypothetical protein